LTKLTPKKDWKPAFLEAYRESGNVTESAEAAGVTKQAVYKARKSGKAFREEWETAREELADDLEAVAVKRARNSSDTMLIFLLKGLKPDTYGDKLKHLGDPARPVEIVIGSGDRKSEDQAQA
jgi:hypothetical protein